MKVSHYQAPGELGVKIVENTLVNIELSLAVSLGIAQSYKNPS